MKHLPLGLLLLCTEMFSSREPLMQKTSNSTLHFSRFLIVHANGACSRFDVWNGCQENWKADRHSCNSFCEFFSSFVINSVFTFMCSSLKCWVDDRILLQPCHLLVSLVTLNLSPFLCLVMFTFFHFHPNLPPGYTEASFYQSYWSLDPSIHK